MLSWKETTYKYKSIFITKAGNRRAKEEKKKKKRKRKSIKLLMAHLHSIPWPHLRSCLGTPGWNLQAPGERDHDNRLRVRFHRGDRVAAMFDQLSIGLSRGFLIGRTRDRVLNWPRIKLAPLGYCQGSSAEVFNLRATIDTCTFTERSSGRGWTLYKFSCTHFPFECSLIFRPLSKHSLLY